MKYIYMNKTDSIEVSDRHISICSISDAVRELNEIIKRAEAAESGRDAQFETNVRLLQENIELRARAAQLEAERDELARQLAEAQQRIKELDATLKDIATAPYENNLNDGNEW